MRINPFIFLSTAFKYIPKKQNNIIYTNIEFIEKKDYNVLILDEEPKKKKKKENIPQLEGLSIIFIDQNYEDIKNYNTEYIIIIHKYRFIYYLNNNFRNSNVNNKKLICSLPFSYNDDIDPTIKHNLWYSILKNNEYKNNVV